MRLRSVSIYSIYTPFLDKNHPSSSLFAYFFMTHFRLLKYKKAGQENLPAGFNFRIEIISFGKTGAVRRRLQ